MKTRVRSAEQPWGRQGRRGREAKGERRKEGERRSKREAEEWPEGAGTAGELLREKEERREKGQEKWKKEGKGCRAQAEEKDLAEKGREEGDAEERDPGKESQRGLKAGEDHFGWHLGPGC